MKKIHKQKPKKAKINKWGLINLKAFAQQKKSLTKCKTTY